MTDVSVIVPTYNRARILPRALRSILGQTFNDFEVIVVNDGSTDNTKQVVKSFSDRRIYYLEKENGGLGSALNVGIKRSKGEFITFCDDDDELLEEKLSLQTELLKDVPQTDICYSDYYFALAGKLSYVRVGDRTKNILFHLFMKSFLAVNALMLRRSCFDKIGYFDERIAIGVDYDLQLRMARSLKFAYLPKPTAICYRHQANMTLNKEGMRDVLTVLKKNFTESVHLLSLSDRRKIKASILFRTGKYYFWQCDYKKARRYFLKAIRGDYRYLKTYPFLVFTFLGLSMFRRAIKLYKIVSRRIYFEDVS